VRLAAGRPGPAERAGAVPVIAQAVSAPAASKAAALTASAMTCERRSPGERRWRLRRADESGWPLLVTPAA